MAKPRYFDAATLRDAASRLLRVRVFELRVGISG